jgi:hypothetical protein
MKCNPSSKKCCDNESNFLAGALTGIAIVALHHVYHAISGSIPEQVLIHVLGEMIAGGLCGALVLTAFSVICNRIKGTP